MGKTATWLACAVLLSGTVGHAQEPGPDDEKCGNNIANLIKCCHLYSDVMQNQGKFPPRLEDLAGDYVKDPMCFVCPRAKLHTQGKGGVVAVCDYVYLPGSTPVDATNIVIFCPKKNHDGKYIYAIGAGSVEMRSEQHFRRELRQTVARLNMNLKLPPKPTSKPPTKEELKALDAHLAKLGSEAFAEREAAAEALEAAGEAARPTLEQGAKNSDPEVAGRCRHLLSELRFANLYRDRIVLLRRILEMDSTEEAPKK